MAVEKLTNGEKTIEGLLQEDRVFEPSPEFVARANVRDKYL